MDRLRQYAGRVVAAFPQTLPGYESFGYHDAESLLTTPITDANGIAAWTDSIFNASYPLPADTHTGMLPQAAGYHHYPKPIVDIDHFRFSDFKLFVTDSAGLPAVVVPVSPRGSGDGRVRLMGRGRAQAAEAARRLTADGGRPIGEALLDQRNVAGFGTVYMAETLFLRGVDPSRPAGDVEDLTALVELGHRLLDANKERLGHVTTGDARPGRESWVYGRAGRPCRRCGTLIRRAEQGAPGQERLRFWCPNCQR